MFHGQATNSLGNYEELKVDNRNQDGSEAIPGKPYYNSNDDLTDVNYANATWDSKTNSGEITLFDIPSESGKLDKTDIESYFVLTNYNNTDQDLIVGKVVWGFTREENGNVKGVGEPRLVLANSFSKTAQNQVRKEYPNYSTLPN